MRLSQHGGLVRVCRFAADPDPHGPDPISANATNRIPVLIGAVTATMSFQAKNALPWRMALKLGVPTTLGGFLGALLAEQMPARDLGLGITAELL